jgi:ribosomal protein S12 methylthiotransferase accessory factor
MIVWRNRLPVPAVHIDPKSELGRFVSETFERPGLEYSLFHTTLDTGIPSFFGVLRDVSRTPAAMLVGGAAHPDPAAAAVKTLLELVQGLKWLDYAPRKEIAIEEGFANIRSFEHRMFLYAYGQLPEAFDFLMSHNSSVDFDSIASLAGPTIPESARACIGAVERLGLEALGIDVTSPDVRETGLHVVRVMIPGCVLMEGDHLLPFRGGRRWKDMPVELGWRAAAIEWPDVNPFPHPYP